MPCPPPPQAVDHLESFIADCDRRTELAKKRLAETQEEISAEVAAKVSLGSRRRAVKNIGVHTRDELTIKSPFSKITKINDQLSINR